MSKTAEEKKIFLRSWLAGFALAMCGKPLPFVVRRDLDG